MSLFLFPALFLLAAGEPQTAEPPAQPPAPAPVAAPAPQAKPEEPKIVCRNERITGSRVAKERVCRPVGGTHNDLDAATQRDLGLNRTAPSAMPEGAAGRPSSIGLDGL